MPFVCQICPCSSVTSVPTQLLAHNLHVATTKTNDSAHKSFHLLLALPKCISAQE
uniref:Uncharacterized protein n=1 Tax=Anguilla anguilla TaxID=7936 RepID=A0A0E9W410_ANGAN